MCAIYGGFSFPTSGDLHLWPLKVKIGTPDTPAHGTFTPIWLILSFFCFRVRSPCGTDGQTDRQTGKTHSAARPNNNVDSVDNTMTAGTDGSIQPISNSKPRITPTTFPLVRCYVENKDDTFVRVCSWKNIRNHMWPRQSKTKWSTTTPPTFGEKIRWTLVH